MNYKGIVQIVCGEFLVAGKTYPGSIPAEIKPWYGYTEDGGHSAIC